MSAVNTSSTSSHNSPRASGPPGPRTGNAQQKSAYKYWQQGVKLSQQGQLAAAAAVLEKSVKYDPAVSLYWLNWANVLNKLGRSAPALVAANKAFELDRNSAVACHLLAELLRLNNRPQDMLQALMALAPQTPRDDQHHRLLGAAYVALQAWQEAAASFLTVLSMKPADVEAYNQLGQCFARLARYIEAAECYRTVAILDPSAFDAALYAAHYSAWACDWPAFEADHERMRQAQALIYSREQIGAFSPFCLLSMNDDAAMHRWAAALEARRVAWHMRTGPEADEFKPLWSQPHQGPGAYPRIDASKRCRIGLISSDFRTHATSILLVQVLERLDRERFEVVLYSHGVDDQSPLRLRLAAAADQLVECATMSAYEEARRIRDDGVTILIELNGYTHGTRMSVFALRPAPIQVLWLAYPSTTGSDFIDYIIGDPTITPLAHADDFSEHIAQLPVCYEPTDRDRERPAPLSRAECGLPEEAFVYACFNQSYKITAPVFDMWCRILQRTSGSVLWLLVPQADVQARLRAAAQAQGVDPQRLIFAPFIEPKLHLARLPQADLFLDTFPYGAHTTCSDALWMGLPVLALIGRSFSARVAASLLNAVGLPELTARCAGDYEEMAVRLCAQPDILATIRHHLDANRMQLPLWDSARFSAELGDMFSRMRQRWQAGLPPAALPAAPAACAATD